VKIAELTENFNGMSIEIRKKEKLLQQEQWAYLNTHPSKRLHYFCFDDDDDEDYTSAITPDEPVLSTAKPDNSLSMGDEHLDTISTTESDEFIKFGVENLIPIPSESEGIPEHMCNVPSHDNSPPLDVSKDQIEDFSESNEEFSSIDDDSFSLDDIDYVEASPPDSEFVSSEVMEIVILEVRGIDDDILLTIKDDVLREKLVNVNLLISKIEALNANPTPSSYCKTKSSSTSLNSLLEETNTFDNSLPEFETFCFDVEEISSGSTTTHPDISLSKYEVFHDDHVKEIKIEDDNLREKLLNVHLLIANIEALKDNHTQSFELLTKSSSTSLNSFLEETNTFHNSLPKFENFYFDSGEISSGSTTTHSDISFPDYEAFSFDDDHVKQISSGSTTTHSDISLSQCDSFIFDLTHEEFVDELAHIISPSEYDRFYFWNLPDPGELMYVLNFGIRESLPSATSVNLPIEDDHSPLLAYVVWIFVAYLTYPVIPLYLHPFGNEDTIFDPSITINRFYSFKPGLSHRRGAFKKFNTHRSHLNEWPMIINGKNTPILDVLLFHFYPP
nr:hypothetical protein [Tanacetum cinerariifolium]